MLSITVPSIQPKIAADVLTDPHTNYHLKVYYLSNFLCVTVLLKHFVSSSFSMFNKASLVIFQQVIPKHSILMALICY